MNNTILRYEVIKLEQGQRLDTFLTKKNEDLSRNYVQTLIKEGRVWINEVLVDKCNHIVKESDQIKLLKAEPVELEARAVNIPLDILYEDEDLLIVNKPKGMVVHPAAGHWDDTLVNALLYHCKDHLSGINGVLRPGIVHRIDKDTTGAIIVCKNDRSHQKIAEQLKEHSITRKYVAIVHNNLKEETGTIDMPLGRDPYDRRRRRIDQSEAGKRAVTHYKVLNSLNHQFNYIECQLETGRTHQIRVHMAYIGHPLLGDPFYGPKKCPFKNLQGQTLHAETIGFIHPTKEEYMEFHAPLPEYFQKLLNQLEEK